MPIETFILTELIQEDFVDAHIKYIEGEPFLPVSTFSILEIDEDGLLTAVLISLLSDRRVVFDGNPPLTEKDRRGWWGDNTLEANDFMGSRLWTLEREKMIEDTTLNLAQSYIEESLHWLLDDGVAEYINITVTRLDRDSLKFQIDIKRPSEDRTFKYYFVWQAVAQLIGQN